MLEGPSAIAAARQVIGATLEGNSAWMHWGHLAGDAVYPRRQAGRKLGGDYVEVHYEDLVRNPAKVLQDLEPFIEHELDYARITEVGIGSVTKPNTAFEEGQQIPVGRWKTALSLQETATLESLVGRTLEPLGYELSTKAASRSDLARMRTAYRLYFESRQYLKTRTPAGKFFVKRDLSWV